MIPTPAINTSLCPERLGGRCTRCLEVCPTGAISLHGEPAIAADSCSNCGACASVCPTGALAHATPASLLRGVEESAGSAPLVLRCPNAGQCTRDDVPVPHCLSCLGLEPMLALWLYRKASVTFFTGNCSNCKRGDGGATFRTTLRQARAILAQSKEAPKDPFIVTRGSKDTPASRRANDMSFTRRGFLNLLAGGTRPSSTEAGIQGADGKRTQLAHYLRRLDARGPVPEGMVSGMIQGIGDCTACGACVNACPTGALDLTGGRVRTLRFISALCVDCGTCIKVCRSRFLHSSPSSLDTITASPHTLFQGGTGTCKRCGAQTAILTDSGHCPTCAHKLHLMESRS